MLDALVIGTDVKSVTEGSSREGLLARSLDVASRVDGDWNVFVAGYFLNELESTALKSLSGNNGRLWQAGLALFGGVRGAGLPALVQELGLAANRAAGFGRDAHTAFVFKDPTLVDALANKGRGPRVLERCGCEQDGLVAVLTNPGLRILGRQG